MSNRDRGSALLMTLVMSLILMPVVLYFAKKSSAVARLLHRERMGSAAARLGDNLMEDYLSQFTKGSGYYENHFSADVLERTQTFFEAGFSSVTVQSDVLARTVLVRARGDYGGDPNLPKTSRSLEALFRFIPLMGQYGIQSDGGYGFMTPNMTVRGPVRTGGDLYIGAANITFNDPVVAGHDVIALSSTKFLSQVYYGNSFSPAYTASIYTAGVPIKDTPPDAPFAIDRGFYQLNSTTYSLGTTVWWEFRDNAGVGEYRSRWDANADHKFTGADPAPGLWTPIPAGGGIFYVDNAKTFVSGRVRGRISIVCYSPNIYAITDRDHGVIEVVDSFRYAVGDLAAVDQSIFVLSSRGYLFSLLDPTPQDLVVDGAYYGEYMAIKTHNACEAFVPPVRGVWARRVNSSLNAIAPQAGDRFVFNGSWNKMSLCDNLANGTSPITPAAFDFDPNLQLYPAPGVPEKAVLVSWRRGGS